MHFHAGVLSALSDPITNQIDGFGLRSVGTDPETGDAVELLDLAPELVQHDGFASTLAERVARFATVRHMSYVHLRRLDRPTSDRLQLVSEHMRGWRLSELLAESTDAGLPVDIAVALGLLRQLLPAVALYNRHNRDAAIGALAPERLIVTPQARLVIAEHAFGPALDQLNLGRDRLWQQLRVAMPPTTGLPRANQRADAMGMGMVALALMIGRVLDAEEFPSKLQSLAESAQEYHDGKPSPLAKSFAGWLIKALQLDDKASFQTPSEAQMAFETVLISERSYVTTPAKLEEWVTALGGRIDARRPPEPAPVPEPVAVQIVDEPQMQVVEEEPAQAAEEVVIPLDEAEVTIPLEEAEVPVPIAEPLAAPEPVEQVAAPVPEEVAAYQEPVQEDPPAPVVEPQQQEQPVQFETAATQYSRPPVAPPVEPEPTPAVPDVDPIAEAIAKYVASRPAEPEPKHEAPAAKYEQPKYEEPEPEPEPEEAEPEQPAYEEPQHAAPQYQAPKLEEPKYEAPKYEAPKYEEPKYEPPKYEAPKYEPPKYEQPAREEPKEEEQKQDDAAHWAPPPPPPQFEAPPHEQRAPQPVQQYQPPAPRHEETPQYEQAAAYEAPAEETPPAYQAPAPVAPVAPAPRAVDDDDAPRSSRTPLLIMAGVIVLLLAVVGWLFTRPSSDGGGDSGALKAGEGELVVTTRTPGAAVKVDGKDAGVTPATIRLQSGAHVIEVQMGKGEPRVVPVMIKAGVQTAQYVELTEAKPLPPPKVPAEKGRKR